MATQHMAWRLSSFRKVGILVSTVLTATSLLLAGCKTEQHQQSRITRLPAFELVDQDGNAFGSKDLAGKPYVTAFFFTSCVTICPKIMGAMASLQSTFKQKNLDVHLLAITVDPENDTPERLRAAGKKAGADFGRWTFLTGSKAEVTNVIVHGFKTFVGSRKKLGDDLFDIGHGARFVLVDDTGGVLGNYEHTEFGLSELVKRIERL